MFSNGQDYMELAGSVDWDAVQLAHYIPGRVRLRSKQLRTNPALADRIRQALGQVDAISQVRISRTTGSLLIQYAPDQVEALPVLIDRAETLGLLPDGMDPDGLRELAKTHANGTAPARTFAEEEDALFGSLDERVRERTDGTFDLKSLAPLTLFAFGIRSLFRGGLQPVPQEMAGVVLLEGNLRRIPDALDVARKSIDLIGQN